MKKTKCRTVVLTSRENFRWLSMQEIVPLIERNWLSSTLPSSHEVICRNVDDLSLSELMPDLYSADNIVFTCFTVKLCRIGALLREIFSIEARYFIYLHNQATIACWPFHKWGLGEHLREDDVFISSSTADAQTFSHSFKNARVEVIPFTHQGLKRVYKTPMKVGSEIPFVYVGRLSVQKNLHTLLYAFKVFKEANPNIPCRLHIYGKDDDLGSPNMGMPSKEYGNYLRQLTKHLALEKGVLFKGYRNRKEIEKYLDRRLHISVSASLHSDENFGMAQFRSISRGNLAVLSRWGGYEDFGTNFRKNVFLTRVEETPNGPWLDPFKLAGELEKAAKNFLKRSPNSKFVVPHCYQEDVISKRLYKLATESFKIGRPLKKTKMTALILKKKESFEHPCKIFESYSDPQAKAFFEAYGMRKGQKTNGRTLDRVLCYPWVKVGRKSISVRDPHRGNRDLPLKDGTATVIDWFGKSRNVSHGTIRSLLSLGYSHSVEDR